MRTNPGHLQLPGMGHDQQAGAKIMGWLPSMRPIHWGHGMSPACQTLHTRYMPQGVSTHKKAYQ